MVAEYLVLGAFEIIRADCFWEGWEEFKDIASEQFLDVDFSSLKLIGTEAMDEDGGDGQGDTLVGEDTSMGS